MGKPLSADSVFFRVALRGLLQFPSVAPASQAAPVHGLSLTILSEPQLRALLICPKM